mgnify:FL=1
MLEETVEATVAHEITSDLILDLYEQYKELDEGPDKEAFLGTIKVLSENIGDLLVLTQDD